MITKQLTEEKVKIRCINCSREIDKVLICEMDSVIGMRYAFFCGLCQKFIGISERRNKFSPIASHQSSTVVNSDN